MTTIGYATLQIIPSLRGVTDAIDQQIDGKIVSVSVEPKVDDRAAEAAGKKAREAVEKQTREVKVEPKVDQRAASKAGEDAAKDFGKAFDRLGKDDLIKLDPDKAKRSGQKAGEGAAQGVEEGVKKADLKTRLGQSIQDAFDHSAKGAADTFSKTLGVEVDRSGLVGGFVTAGRNAAREFGNELRVGVGTTIGEFAPEVSDRLGKTITERFKSVGKSIGDKGVLGSFGGAVLEGAADDLGKVATAELRTRGSRLSEIIAGRKFKPEFRDQPGQGRKGQKQRGRGGGAAAFVDEASAVGDSIGELDTALERTKGLLGGEDSWAAPGIEKLQAVLGSTAPAMAALGVAAEASSIGTAAMASASKVATAAQWLWNAALTANPIGLIVTAIGAVVAGLVLFFTKTELGRKIWAEFTELLTAAWEKVKTAFQVSWTAIKVVFDAWVTTAGEVWSGIRDRFTAVVDFVKGLPRAITNAAKGMWDGLKLGLVTVLNWISDKWNSFADGLSFHIPGTSIDVKMPKLPKFSGGGYTGNMPIDQIAGVVHGGEHVIKADSRERIENAYPGLLDYLNNNGKLPGYQGGGLVAGAEQLRKIISDRFGISNIGGYRPGGDGFDEHVTGRALDVMVGNNSSKGDQVRDFALANADAIDLKWVIWKQHLTYPGGGGYDMEDRGSPTKNHMDHVHIFSGTGIINGLRGSLKPAEADIDAAAPAPDDAAQQAPAGSDVAPAAASSGGASVPSSISGLSSFGLSGLGSGVGATKSGSDLSLFGDAAGAAVSGQVSSALGVLGVGDSPGWLKGIGTLVGGISVSGADGKKIFGGGSVGSALTGAGNLFGGSQQSVAPIAAAPATAPQPAGVGAVHGSAAGQRPGPPGPTYNIRTATVEDAFLVAQRREDEMNAAKLSRF